MNRPSILQAALALAVCADSTLAGAETTPLPRFATHERTDIACDATPFGRSVTLGGEHEAIDMIATSAGFTAFDEYQYQPPADPPVDPLARTFRNGLFPGALAGTTFIEGAAIDLDGDGRDEVVTANRVPGSNALRLGVFRRGTPPSAELVDTWTLNQPITGAALAVGDFDGSADGKQELAVFARNASGMQVFILTGAPDGTIAQGDDASAGHWSRSGSTGEVGFAAGDVLLDGRAQAVIVAETGNNASRTLNYHLLEFQPTTSALPVAGGDSAIGSILFQSVIGFDYSYDEGMTGIGTVERIHAAVGDVVDSAAAELVVHMLFRQGEDYFLGQRLHHFTTTRDASNAITAIGFASRGVGKEYDDSRLVIRGHQNSRPSFEAVIANVDRVSPGEIVLVRSAPDPRLYVEAYKAGVDLAAGYLYSVNHLVVQFENTSTGTIATNTWDFGDGSGPIHDRHPIHVYTSAGTRTVTLTITDNLGATRTYQQPITVGPGQTGTGGAAPGFMYHLQEAPTYEGSYPVSGANDLQDINVAVADMDKDGIAEIMTLSRNETQNLLRTVWHLTDVSNPASFSGRYFNETSNDFVSLTALDLVAADFDGDSVEATLGTDCRRVEEPQVRQVVWLPPYFRRLQAGAEKYASFGKSTSGGTAQERQVGSFTSHDVSAYLGVAVGGDVLGIGAKATVKATAGYNYQASYGAIHGTENSYQVDQGFSQDGGEALAVVEDNSFNCYSYDVHSAAGGIDPGSGTRMCEAIDGSRLVSATDARAWDTTIPAVAPGGKPPAQWFPLQRDWASLALFRPVASNAALVADSGADKATDGLFRTEARSSAASAQPYLQIDLGSVREVSNIRVFPATGAAAAMTGFRVYASAQPFAGDGVPGGSAVKVYAPETSADVTYDRWNIWTRERANPANLLRARYIRLQHPGNAMLRVAEIQVFGDIHVEPPTYPDVVCDPVKDDGHFNALVWDAAAQQFRSIEVRGDLLWNGTGTVKGCPNYSGLRSADIWDGIAIGASGSQDWNLSQSTTNLVGQNTSFESSIRVGAEFDVEGGFIAQVVAGGAYEYSSGVTEENQTTSFWGTALEIGGAIGGFEPGYETLVSDCRYTPRPYAYRLQERSNTGYQHDIYTVDYIVRESSGTWRRNAVPVLCLRDDPVFADGFD